MFPRLAGTVAVWASARRSRPPSRAGCCWRRCDLPVARPAVAAIVSRLLWRRGCCAPFNDRGSWYHPGGPREPFGLAGILRPVVWAISIWGATNPQTTVPAPLLLITRSVGWSNSPRPKNLWCRINVQSKSASPHICEEVSMTTKRENRPTDRRFSPPLTTPPQVEEGALPPCPRPTAVIVGRTT